MSSIGSIKKAKSSKVSILKDYENYFKTNSYKPSGHFLGFDPIIPSNLGSEMLIIKLFYRSKVV